MSSEQIKQIRELTGAGLLEVKNALEEAGGNSDQAVEILRKKGSVKLAKKSDRTAKEGIIESYIHAQGRIGVLVEVNCETDFVARTDDFKELARDLALHVAASGPLYVSREEVPVEVLEKEKDIYRQQVTGKPADVLEKIVEGKVEKFYEDTCLLDQPFVKNPDQKVKDLVAERVAKMGENVQIRRFARFVLGN